MGDVWDIGVIAPIARERTGYPSQKPEALLERLLSALTSEGDLVIDPYAGSGTTLAVAHRMSRRFVRVDSRPVPFEMFARRFAAHSTGPPIALPSDPHYRPRYTCHFPSPSPPHP